MPEARTRCALVLIDDDARSVQLLARLSHADSYSVAMTVGAAAGARRRTLRMLARLLRSDGCLVDSSIGDWAALERLARLPQPDVLVIDVDADHEVALNVVRHARAASPMLGVLLLTDRATELESATADIAPPPVILEKPIEYAELRARLWELSQSRTTSAIVPIRQIHAARRTGHRS
jgi:DNA-binding response OmpR family regulator